MGLAKYRAEKVADWGFDAGMVLSVPEYSEDEVLEGPALADDGHGKPEPYDRAGALDVADFAAFSCGDVDVLVLAGRTTVEGGQGTTRDDAIRHFYSVQEGETSQDG